MREVVVNGDTALSEFERFAIEMDLSLDMKDMDAEDKEAFTRQRDRMLRAIEYGDLTFNENGEAVYTPCRANSKHKDPIVFHERSGASIMAMDGKKRNHEVAKTYAVMAQMCRVHTSVFANLVGTDIKVCEAIYTFLMD